MCSALISSHPQDLLFFKELAAFVISSLQKGFLSFLGFIMSKGSIASLLKTCSKWSLITSIFDFVSPKISPFF